MPFQKSAGAVIFREEGNERYYLLLHYQLGHWDFPKGHIEKGENVGQSALREIEEETGIKEIKFIDGFKEWIKYFFRQEGKNIFKVVHYLLAQTIQKEVKISFEHIGFKWLPYREALGLLTFQNAKEILTKANDFLLRQQID